MPHSGRNMLPVCAPPDARVPPQFQVFFRRHIPGIDISMDGIVDGFQISCVMAPANGTDVSIGFDLHFLQTWNLEKLAIGDLSSTIALAPPRAIDNRVSELANEEC